MGMPHHLVLVRHGESEGNLAIRRSFKHGDETAFTDEFKERHSWRWRLTKDGRKQARIAGAWIRAHIRPRFDGYFTSEYVRAMETAGLLNLPGALWKKEFYLRERDGGLMEREPASVRRAKYAKANEERRREPLLWTPEQGVSVAEVCLRGDRVIDTLHREYDGKMVVMVCHGEMMLAIDTRLQRRSIDEFNRMKSSKHPHNEFHNCQILHYTRVNPRSTVVEPYYNWVRSVCPWDLSLSSNEWQPIVRKKFTNKELLADARRFPQMVF
jgi:broad specificity phosphatase PhoE